MRIGQQALAAMMASLAIGAAAQAQLQIISPIETGTGAWFERDGAFDDQPTSFTYDAVNDWYKPDDGGAGENGPSYKAAPFEVENRRVVWFDFGPDWENIRIHEFWLCYQFYPWPGVNVFQEQFPHAWWDNDNDEFGLDPIDPLNTDTDGAFQSVINPVNNIDWEKNEVPMANMWILDQDFKDAPVTPLGRYLLFSSGYSGEFGEPGVVPITYGAPGRVGEFAFIGEIVSASLTGDLNGDGFVGQDDLNIVLGAWGTNVTPGDPLAGDPSGDGFVGQDDLNDVLAGWGQGTPPSGLVPEPASAALLALGGLAMLRRRR